MMGENEMIERYKSLLEKIETENIREPARKVSWRLMRTMLETTTAWLLHGLTDSAQKIKELESRIEQLEPPSQSEESNNET